MLMYSAVQVRPNTAKQIPGGANRNARAAGSKQAGYTIIEVLIVLGVTAVLFAAAVIFIGGRQSRVEFTQSVNDLKGALEQAINQAGSGYYADTGGLGTGKRCDPGTNGIQFSTGSTGLNNKGTNQACVAIGQAFQFGLNDGTLSQKYTAYTIGALRSGTSLATAKPTLIYNNGTPLTVNGNYPDARVDYRLKGGMRVWSMRYVNGATSQQIGGFALVNRLGSYSNGLLNSGTQSLNLFPLLPQRLGIATTTNGAGNELSTDVNTFTARANEQIRNLGDDPLSTTIPYDANPSGGIQICVNSGGTRQSALITVGGEKRAMSVNTQFFDGSKCT